MSEILPPLAGLMIILGLISSFVFVKNKQHPRELFAFFALFGWMGWLLLMGSVWDSPNLGEMDMGYSHSTSEEWQLFWWLILLSVTGLSFWWMSHVHQQWPLDIVTEKDFWRRTRKEKASIFTSAGEQLRSFAGLEWTLPLRKEEGGTHVSTILEPVNRAVVPWRINALEILNLLHHQYTVHEVEDWYSDHECYLCSYGKEQDGTAILCCEEKPDEDTIAQLMKFVTERKAHYDSLLILIEQGDEQPSEVEQGSLLIKYRYKAEMLAQLVDFKPYFKDLQQRFEEEEIYEGSQQTLADSYTPLSARTNANATQLIPNIEQYILDWTAKEQTVKHLALLGEYGQGKSVLSLKVSFTLSQQQGARIPVLIELRGKSPRTMSLKEILYVWAKRYGISTEALLKLHQEGCLLLIFEGFDEMDLAGDKGMRLEHFRQLWEFAQAPKAKLLFTGRPNFFIDELEQRQALGLFQQPLPDFPYCEALSLQLFSSKQLLTSLRQVDPSTRESIQVLLEKNERRKDSNFYNMIARPATLSLIAIIWKKAYFDQRKDRLNSALVIQEYIQFTYERQKVKHSSMPLSIAERQYFMMGIAVGMMQQDGYSNQLSKHQLRYLVEQLLINFPAALSKEQTDFELSRASLRERLLEDGKILPERKEAILTDIRTCGILVKDPSKLDHFKFAHKSFLEYLVSAYYVATLLEKETTSKRMTYGINRAIEQAHHIRPSSEVIKFVGELLANEQLPENPYSIAQHLSKLLKLNIPALYFAFMKKKVYLVPVPFLTVVGIALLVSTVVSIAFYATLHFFNQPVSTTLLSVIFYGSLFLCYTIVSKRMNKQNEDTLLRTHIWYKTCQACNIQRVAMGSVVGNATLLYIERYLRKIGVLDTTPLPLLGLDKKNAAKFSNVTS